MPRSDDLGIAPPDASLDTLEEVMGIVRHIDTIGGSSGRSAPATNCEETHRADLGADRPADCWIPGRSGGNGH